MHQPDATEAPALLAHQQLGSGPDVILIHGLAANRAFWYPIATALATHYRVTLYDLRGHGYSARPPNGYAAVDHARDLLALMDKLDIGSASVVGHSFGGSVALETAGLAPPRVSRLALLDTRINALQPEMRLHDVDFRSPFETLLLDRYREMAERETQIGIRFLEAAAQLQLDGDAPVVDNDFNPFGQGRGARRAAKAWLDLLANTDARRAFSEPGVDAARIREIKVPSLLMYAQYSRCMPSGRTLQQLWPQAVFVEVADAGHFFPLSHAAKTLDALRDFVADI